MLAFICVSLQRHQHRFESLVDVDAIERLFTLLAMTTPNLVDFYEKTATQGSLVEGDAIYQPDTILRIISHRDDRMGAWNLNYASAQGLQLLIRLNRSLVTARDFVKRALRAGRGAGSAAGGGVGGLSPGRGHTATDLATLYSNRSATMSNAKRRFS
eukprot:COSAG03_NODE_566_length_6920_cov_2.711626_5_plen_157_part_00